MNIQKIILSIIVVAVGLAVAGCNKTSDGANSTSVKTEDGAVRGAANGNVREDK